MMKKNLITRTLTWLLAAVLLFQSAPITDAFAQDGEDITVIEVNEVNTEDTVSENEVVETEDTGELDVLGNTSHIADILDQQAQHPNNVTIEIPNSDTWKFQQTFAREVFFPMLQEARMNSDNWWTLYNGTRVELDEQYYLTDDDKYVYDYQLEAYAMQRAAELAASFNVHYRADGVTGREALYEMYQQDNTNTYIYANNLCALNTGVILDNTDMDAATAYEILWGNGGYQQGFMEEKGQNGCEHRNKILAKDYNRIGIGVVRTNENGRVYLVIELAEDTYDSRYIEQQAEAGITIDPSIPLSPYTEPVDECRAFTMKVGYGEAGLGLSLDLRRNQVNTNIAHTLNLQKGETFDFADEWFSDNSNDFGIMKGNSEWLTGWYSTDTSVVTVNGTTLTAVGAGTATILTGNIQADGTSDNTTPVEAAFGITVTEPNPVSYGVTLDRTNLSSNGAYQWNLTNSKTYTLPYTLTAKDGTKVSVTANDIQCSTSNPNVTVTKTASTDGLSGTFVFTYTGSTDSVTGANLTFSCTSADGYIWDSNQPGGYIEITNGSSSGTVQNNTTTTVKTINSTTTTRKAQTITVSKKASKTVNYTRKALKKSSMSFKISASAPSGRITYKVTKYPKGAKKYISVSSTGKVTIKKGAKKGTYQVTVTAPKTSKYNKATRKVTIKVS
jgi:hypothetical protein